jgi:hypothetical protein
MGRARFVFDYLHTHRSGLIDAIEWQRLLIQCSLPDDDAQAYLSDDEDKRFSFDEFYHKLKPIWEFAYENMTVCDVGQVMQPPNARLD